MTKTSLSPRPVRKIGEKGLASTVCACVCKAHVKLCKCVSNDGQYLLRTMTLHISAFYDIAKEVSAALLIICPGLLTPVLITLTALLTYVGRSSHCKCQFVSRIITGQVLVRVAGLRV